MTTTMKIGMSANESLLMARNHAWDRVVMAQFCGY
jgi:hypothetical protein